MKNCARVKILLCFTNQKIHMRRIKPWSGILLSIFAPFWSADCYGMTVVVTSFRTFLLGAKAGPLFSPPL